MVLKIEGEDSVPLKGMSLPPRSGSFVGRKVEPVMAHGIYCVAVPVGLGAKVLSLAGSAANQLTFRPVVSSLSAIGWLGGHSLSVAGQLTEIIGKIFQTDMVRRAGLEGSVYTEEYFHKAMGVRASVGEAADLAVSYIPYIGGPAVSLERGEREAERVLSSAGRGVLSRIWKAAVSLLPIVGMALEYSGRATE